MKILITGAAGFIGYHTIKIILSTNPEFKIIGIDSINNYYSQKLKIDRIKDLKKHHKKNFVFKRINICNKKKLNELFKKSKFHTVVNLAAQAGVRYSLKNPEAYFENNLRGFFNILEASRVFKIKHLISASTSSVYGDNDISTFNVEKPADHPIQFYAATKRSNEIIGHAYSYINKLPITFLRFFTVYGPWGRPDMSLFLFVKNILQNKPINVYNFGKHSRDFTYIDDIVNGIQKVVKKIPKKNKKWNPKKPDQSSSTAPFKILNLGNGKRISLLRYIKVIERNLGKKAIIKFSKMQQGDIQDTLSDIKETQRYINFKPKTSLENGISIFVKWYKNYYK
jgi:UDP-glucuronate 4-epimerase